MTKIIVEWSVVYSYRATIDLTDPRYGDVTPDDFPSGTEALTDRVHEVLSDLEVVPGTQYQVDGVKISRVTTSGD
jgi:hypothetical protein